MNLLILLFFFILAAAFHQSLYILIPGVSLFYILAQKKGRLTLTPLVRLYTMVVVVAFGFFIVQSLLYVDINAFSVKGIARYFSYLLFAVLVSFFDKTDIKRFFRAIILIFSVTFPLGIYQVLTLGRYQGIFNHANHFAYALCFCIYFLIFHRPFTKATTNLCLSALLLSLFLTKSSGATLVLLILLAYGVYSSKKLSLANKLILAATFVLISSSVLLFSTKIAFQLETLTYLNWDFLEEKVEEFKVGGYGSFIWRVVYWIKILLSFCAEPLEKILFGVGVDTMTEGNMPYPYMYKDPHNDFLKVLVEFGVMGILLFFLFLKRIYQIVHKNFKIIILIIVPIFFGNTIVNFPFNLILILLLTYEHKKYHLESN